MSAQTSSRKQWRLFRGPKGNIQSLGWAEFGCPESQVKLAKELLDENGEECVDKEENCRLGVYWLLKASEKGHDEATRMLQECLDNGTGITEHNLSDVRCCLEMPKEEKLSREAAKELFLSLSQGENYITGNQLFRETLKYSEGPFPTGSGLSEEWMLYEKGGEVERLTEEMVVSTGSQHLHGELPTVLNRPLLRLSGLATGTFGLAGLLPLLSPTHFLLALALLGARFVFQTAPSIIYYSSLLVMLLSTSQILAKKWEFNQFRRWSYALVASGCSDEVSAQAQWAHCTQNAHPFLIFIAALVINLISSSFVPMPPYSEIATMSTLVSLYMLYNLTWRKKKLDGVVIFTFILHLVARYPYEIDTFVYHYWRYLDVHVPTFTSLVVGTSIEFCLNFRVILYLMLPGFFLVMASRDRWLGVYTTLLPHLVCLSWWQIAVSASNGATYFGLIRSCLGLVLLVLFLPLSSISTLLVPLLTVAKFFITQQISFPFAFGAVSFASVIYLGTKNKRSSIICTSIQVLLCGLSLFFIMNNSEVESVERTNLKWEELTKICSQEDIQNQERCTAFVGFPVSWEGRVLSTKLSAVHNPLQPLINFLPVNLQKPAVCFFGEKYEDCINREDCNNSIKKCRISNWNRYEYEIEVELGEEGWSESSTIGRLKGGQNFRNFSIALKSGDKIWFSGTVSDQRDRVLHISLLHAKCLSCTPPDHLVLEVHPTPISPLIIDKVFSFIFYPIAILR